MRVLEARFHTGQPKADQFVVVGRVIWRGHRPGDQPIVEPSPILERELASEALISKLRYLVSVAASGSFDRLQALRSRFWSFVESGAEP